MHNNCEDGEVPGTSGQNNERRREPRTTTVESEVGSSTLQRYAAEFDPPSDLEELLNSSSSIIDINDILTTPNDSDDSSDSNNIVLVGEPEQNRTPKKRRIGETCPVCNQIFPINEIASHVDSCLRNSEAITGSDSDDNSDVGPVESEWTRQSPVGAAGPIPQNDTNSAASLNTGEVYQYLSVTSGPPNDPDSTTFISYRNYRHVTLEEAIFGYNSTFNAGCDKKDSAAEATEVDEVIEKLTNEIKEIESKEKSIDPEYKCSICKERYKTPVSSVNCGHVHCEECWKQALEIQAVCPRCGMPTLPVHLTRIYL